MNKQAHLLLTIAATGFGWLAAVGWRFGLADAFTNSGALIANSNPDAITHQIFIITIMTGVCGPIAHAVELGVSRQFGQCQWPAWAILIAMIIGENLSLALCMVAQATISVPAAMNAATTVPTLDLSTINLIPWAAGGLFGGLVIAIALVLVFGALAHPKPQR